MEEKFAGGKFREIPCAVDIYFAGGEISRKIKIREYSENVLHAKNTCYTVFINEDLTGRRATIAFKTRELKKQRKIQDCWTYSGRILVKDNDNNIHEISSDIDLKRFTNL